MARVHGPRPQQPLHLLDLLDRNAITKGAFIRLVNDGCDPNRLLGLFFSAARPSSEVRGLLMQSRKDLFDYRKRVEALATKMRRLAQEIRGIMETDPLSQFLCWAVPLDGILNDQADSLTSTTLPLLKAKSRRFLTDDFPLALLCSYVQDATRKKHYSEIASILTAANGFAGRTQTFLPENLSKKMQRFEGRFGKSLVARMGNGSGHK